jgi:PRTRC genetic system protein F
VHGGFWCIPAISDDIPLVLTSTGTVAPLHIAAFALEGHALGVALPRGKFTDPKHSLQRQWEQYIKGECGPDDPVNLNLQVAVDEDRLRVLVSADPSLNIFRLKPVIERINAIDPKVGWFVYDAVKKASHEGYPIYQISDIADFAQMLWHQDCVTDAELAQQLRENEGTRDSMKTLRETYTFPWPSDMAKAVDGHEWMLMRYSFSRKAGRMVPTAKKPKSATLAQAEAFAKHSRAPADLRKVVTAAIELIDEINRKDSAMRTIPRVKPADLEDSSYLDDDSYINPYGAACMVVWDDPTLMVDALEHWESSEMQDGYATEVHLVLKADVTCEEQYGTVVKQLKDLIRHHACVSRLLKQFPQGYDQ